MTKKITIKVNGETTIISEGLNLIEMLKTQGYTCELVAIALNETFVARDDYINTLVKSNDTLDIVAPMQGG